MTASLDEPVERSETVDSDVSAKPDPEHNGGASRDEVDVSSKLNAEEPRSPQQNLDSVMEKVGAFGRYQVQLLLTTELSYLICAGSLLSAKYTAIPYSGFCVNRTSWELGKSISQADYLSLKSTGNYSTDLCSCAPRNRVTVVDANFFSFFMQLRIFCGAEGLQLALNMAAMGGGVIGAIAFGFLGDRIGRKRTCTLAMAILILADFAMAASAHIAYAVVVMVIVGISCGGVMTGNLAFLLECVGHKYRPLCAALNGWPLGMMVMALTGYLTGHWRSYTIVNACLGIPFLVMFFFVNESPRWLVQHHRIREAVSVFDNIAARNGQPIPDRLETQLQADSDRCLAVERNYTYADLFRHRSTRVKLLALFYSWLASAIISYGIYFTMGALSGNLFLNFFLLGLFKGSTGIIPYVATSAPLNLGRKPILCLFVSITCLCVWLCILLVYSLGVQESRRAVFLTVLTVIAGAAIDPIWKVNHLYSAELFPTVVRSMARGLLNVGSRVGSALSPLMLYLSDMLFIAPYWVYGVLSIGHVLVAFLLLPETKGKPLPDSLDQEEGVRMRKVRDR